MLFKSLSPLSLDTLRATIAPLLTAGSTLADLRLGDKGDVQLVVNVDPALGTAMETLRQSLLTNLQNLKGVSDVQVILTAERAPPPPLHAKEAPTRSPSKIDLPVPIVIAVASGKGGVGKSTVAANLAASMAAQGLRVGLLDADIYGPSQPLLFGLQGEKPEQRDDLIMPPTAHGVRVMSIGFMVDAEAPMIWRGPMVQSALIQLLRDVDWTGLDVLLLDLPPGTGDTQLTLAQKVALTGAVIVSTPQDLALADARKGIAMFEQVNIPILGLIENMAMFCCPHCGTESAIFGHGGAKAAAAAKSIPFLGEIPLHPDLRFWSDAGTPAASIAGNHPLKAAYDNLATAVLANIDQQNQDVPEIKLIPENLPKRL